MFVALGVGSYSRRDLPPLHARLLQGAAVPRLRLGHPRRLRRAGHAQHGRPQDAHPGHLLADDRRHAGADRRRHSRTIIGPPASSPRTPSSKAPSSATMRWPAFAFIALTVAAMFTSFYSWRLIFMTFHGRPRAPAHVMDHVHESPAGDADPARRAGRRRALRRRPLQRIFHRPRLRAFLEGVALHAPREPYPRGDPPRPVLGEARALRRHAGGLRHRLALLHPLARDAGAARRAALGRSTSSCSTSGISTSSSISCSSARPWRSAVSSGRGATAG